MPLSQRERTISVRTVLGDDALLLRGMSASEQISRLFEYRLELLSEDLDIRPSDLLGTQARVTMALPNDRERELNGFIHRFAQAGYDGPYAVYHATLVPWLWFLSRTADCRIFQEQSVPDIVKGVFREHGFSDFDERLSASYRERTYCVQYRETDLNFVSRLLEQEGIYYYFEHHDGKHILVLADDVGANASVPGYEQIPFYEPDATSFRERDHISYWRLVQQVRAGTFVQTDFDFTAPRKDLLTKRSGPKRHEHADAEVFDYPGEYTDSSDGEQYARIRLEEMQADFELAEAEGNARGLTTGALFSLTGYRREDQNREYLVVGAQYELRSDAFRSSGSGAVEPEGPVFTCRFQAIDAQIPYRSPRVTRKPVVQGPQTAIVVGKSGEEIWTDEHGRVKVQFHWDRYGKADEHSSCWVRVSHPWAGKHWGSIAIPRIGQEVIVSFLEGDPDQPMITGRVYNGDCMPPWDLPDNKTRSGTLSRSSKDGTASNCNEIRMEDKKGEEELYFHAEKNQTIEVENDESRWVGHDRVKQVDHDETTQIKNNRTETVGVDEQISIGGNRTESVGVNETIDIGGSRTEHVGANEDIKIGANRTELVGANESVSIGATRTLNVGASEKIMVGATRTDSIGAALMQSVGGPVAITCGGPYTITAAGGMNIIAPGGTKVVDFELCQVGGTIKEGYAMKLDFNGVALEANAAKGEATGSANAVVGLKFEKVGAELGGDDVLQKSYALACLSEATGIEMATLKVLM